MIYVLVYAKLVGFWTYHPWTLTGICNTPSWAENLSYKNTTISDVLKDIALSIESNRKCVVLLN